VAQTMTRPKAEKRTKVQVIDGDIHNAPVSDRALYPFLPKRWQEYHAQFGMRGYSGGTYPRMNVNAARTDAWPPSGLPPGADLPFLREQLLDAWNMQYGICNPLVGIQGPYVEYTAALARAVNDWQVAEWLEPEPRLKGSIVVPYEDGELAAAEIERCARDPRFVQVLLLVRSHEPLGKRRFWKLYEAAEAHNLPVGIHFGGNSGNAYTGAGWPSFYLEDHGGTSQVFQAQIASFVYEGVLERFPGLKLVLIEGGFAWLAPLMWRLDRAWKLLKSEVPDIRRAPSEQIRQQVFLTTQPMEEPPKPAFFNQLLEQLNMTDNLMFATDYPHWDFDAPDTAIPVKLPGDVEAKIMAGNAKALYGLA
jgi:predicted TIM-barrel fold metal-dependent hydrolase